MKKNIKQISKKAYHYGVQLVAVGALTGFFAGLVVTLYNVLAHMAEEFSAGYYGFSANIPRLSRSSFSRLRSEQSSSAACSVLFP